LFASLGQHRCDMVADVEIMRKVWRCMFISKIPPLLARRRFPQFVYLLAGGNDTHKKKKKKKKKKY
jgi:hypothetical protein